MENPSSSSSYAPSTEAAEAAGERKGSKKICKRKNPNSSSSSSRKKKGERSREGLKKGPWTAEEDEMLSNYINKQGIGRWRTLPLRAGLQRCGKSCRLRWMNYLRPNVKRGHISPAEEDIILRLHRLLGNRWSLIAGRIPGRTDNEIKNYWNTHLSKKLLSQGIDPRTHKPLSPPPPLLKPPILNPSPPRNPTIPPSSPQLNSSGIVCPNCHSTPSASVSDTNHSVALDNHPLSFTNLMPNDDHDSTTITTTQVQNPNDPEGEFILNHCNFGEDDDNLVFSSFFNSLIDHVDISPPIPDALLSPSHAYFLPHTSSQGPEDLGTDVFITIPSPSL